MEYARQLRGIATEQSKSSSFFSDPTLTRPSIFLFSLPGPTQTPHRCTRLTLHNPHPTSANACTTHTKKYTYEKLALIRKTKRHDRHAVSARCGSPGQRARSVPMTEPHRKERFAIISDWRDMASGPTSAQFSHCAVGFGQAILPNEPKFSFPLCPLTLCAQTSYRPRQHFSQVIFGRNLLSVIRVHSCSFVAQCFVFRYTGISPCN